LWTAQIKQGFAVSSHNTIQRADNIMSFDTQEESKNSSNSQIGIESAAVELVLYIFLV